MLCSECDYKPLAENRREYVGDGQVGMGTRKTLQTGSHISSSSCTASSNHFGSSYNPSGGKPSSAAPDHTSSSSSPYPRNGVPTANRGGVITIGSSPLPALPTDVFAGPSPSLPDIGVVDKDRDASDMVTESGVEETNAEPRQEDTVPEYLSAPTRRALNVASVGVGNGLDCTRSSRRSGLSPISSRLLKSSGAGGAALPFFPPRCVGEADRIRLEKEPPPRAWEGVRFEGARRCGVCRGVRI